MKSKLCLIAALIVANLGIVAPAQAAAIQPQIVSPAPNSTKRPGYTGPVTVDLTGAVYDHYKLKVEGPGPNFEAVYDYQEGVDPLWVVTLDPMYVTGQFKARVLRDGSGVDSVLFSIRNYQASIAEPTRGQVLKAGEAQRVIVDWDNLPAGTRVTTDISPGENCTFFVTDYGQQTSCKIPSLRAASYVVKAEFKHPHSGYVRTLDRIEFRAFRPLNFSNSRVAPQKFYPLVQDRYRDEAQFRWSSNAPSSADITVTDRAGKVVKRDTTPARRSSHSWSWGGRDKDGNKVAPGTYVVQVTGTDAVGLETSDSFKEVVEVATGWDVEEWRSWRRGDYESSTSVTGTCEKSQPGYAPGELYLDCYGQPGEATARYNLKIHENAYDFEWVLKGEQGCCWEGPMEKFGYRLSDTRYRVGITIGGWRAYYIEKATLTYKRKVRI